MNKLQRVSWIGLILIRSVLTGYIVLLIYFIAACIYTWLTAPSNRSISVNVMAIVIVEGIAVFIFIQSLTTLIQYGRSVKENEKFDQKIISEPHNSKG